MFQSALLVEDRPDLALLLRDALTREGLTFFHASTLYEAREILSTAIPEVLLVDLMLPDGNGLDLIRSFRIDHPDHPVVIITGLDTPDAVIEGLDTGADLYITKPFTPPELFAHLRALCRRVDRPPVHRSAGGIRVDLLDRTVEYCGSTVKLTNVEMRLLDALLEARGTVVGRNVIFQRVWKMDFDPGTGLLHSHIRNLRKKLKSIGLDRAVRSVRGRGYRLNPALLEEEPSSFEDGSANA